MANIWIDFRRQENHSHYKFFIFVNIINNKFACIHISCYVVVFVEFFSVLVAATMVYQ